MHGAESPGVSVLSSIGGHGSRRIIAGPRDALDVTILMDDLAVFIGIEIDPEID